MRRSNFFFCSVVVLLLFSLTGCGGGAGSSSTASSNLPVATNRGTAQLTLLWPTTGTNSRAEGLGYQSAKVTLIQNGVRLGQQTLTRSVGAASAVATFASVPGGDAVVTANLYASQNGSGTPVATYATSLAIVPGQTASTTVTRAAAATDVASISISPSDISLSVGETLTVTATAYDKEGKTIAVPADVKWRWLINRKDILTLSGDTEQAKLTGTGDGLFTLYASVPGSGYTLTVTGKVVQADYDLVDLGDLPDSSEMVPLGINKDGTIIGRYVGRYGLYGGFIWKPSDPVMREAVEILGSTKASATYGNFTAINSGGLMVGYQATGWANIAPPVPATLGLPGAEVLPLSGNFGAGVALGLNDAGQVVGVIETGSVYRPTRAMLWQSSQSPIQLPMLVKDGVAGLYARAIGINASGTIVGMAENGAQSGSWRVYENGQDSLFTSRRNFVMEAVVWTTPQSAPTQICPGIANAISDSGIVIGAKASEPDSTGKVTYTAFRWKQGDAAPTEMGPGTAQAINAAGDIVGTTGTHAALWKAGQNDPVNLSTSISPSNKWVVMGATGITDDGKIIASGLAHGQIRACLLIPRKKP